MDGHTQRGAAPAAFIALINPRPWRVSNGSDAPSSATDAAPVSAATAPASTLSQAPAPAITGLPSVHSAEFRKFITLAFPSPKGKDRSMVTALHTSHMSSHLGALQNGQHAGDTRKQTWNESWGEFEGDGVDKCMSGSTAASARFMCRSRSKAAQEVGVHTLTHFYFLSYRVRYVPEHELREFVTGVVDIANGRYAHLLSIYASLSPFDVKTDYTLLDIPLDPWYYHDKAFQFGRVDVEYERGGRARVRRWRYEGPKAPRAAPSDDPSIPPATRPAASRQPPAEPPTTPATQVPSAHPHFIAPVVSPSLALPSLHTR